MSGVDGVKVMAVASGAAETSAKEESGSTLPMIALMLTVLIGLSAFAIDLGWFYLNATRIQRAADAAALAGVIHMPYDFGLAESDALDLAAANGYIVGSGTSVVVTPVPNEPNMIQVEVEDIVPTFFLKVFGQSDQVINRKARAEFVPPLPLGSPDNTFGNSCDPGQPGCSNQPNFWANIHGWYTRREMGDAFSPICTGGAGDSCSGTNVLQREKGYLYGIEAPSGSFSVNFVDMNFHNIANGTGCPGNQVTVPDGCTSDWTRTGDRGCEEWGHTGSDCGPTIVSTLYGPDADPLVIENNPVICSETWGPQPQVAVGDPYSPVAPSCMSIGSAQAGIYVLQVRVVEPDSQPNSGLNRYGLSVSGAGSRIYGLGDISIFNNFTGSVSDFYLAEVATEYRGKTFVIELFDPGEGDGWIEVMTPTGSDNWNVFSGGCEIYTRPTGVMTGGWDFEGSPGNCRLQADNDDADLSYNDRWVKFEIQLPEGYDCESFNNCWWKINYAYSGGVRDTTTWRAFIVGNPIHLVPIDP
jgi:hypothetical protein